MADNIAPDMVETTTALFSHHWPPHMEKLKYIPTTNSDREQAASYKDYDRLGTLNKSHPAQPVLILF